MIDKERLMMLEDQGFEKVYENSFMRIERVRPFDITRTPYRFGWVARHIPYERGHALDVGCGNGHLAYILSEEGFRLTGIDISKTAIETARRNLKEIHDATFTQVEVDKPLPYADQKFIMVSCCEVLEHAKDPTALLKEMLRVLRPGGKLLITTPVEKNFDCIEHLWHFDFYTLADLILPITDKFKICVIYKDDPKEIARGLFAVEVTK